jgi:hypothetical protein
LAELGRDAEAAGQAQDQRYDFGGGLRIREVSLETVPFRDLSERLEADAAQLRNVLRFRPDECYLPLHRCG